MKEEKERLMSNKIKCSFCNWSIPKWKTTKKGIHIERYGSLLKHMKLQHPEKYQEVINALEDANREMFGDEADYFEAAGIDNIGCK